MSLKNIFEMTKADRYTQDGRDEIAKLAEDVKYKTGDISQKTGLQKQPDGSWAPPKGGAGAKKAAESKKIDYQVTEKGGKFYATGHQFSDGSQLHAGPFGSEKELHEFMNGSPYKSTAESKPAAKEEKPAEEKPTQTKTIKFEEAQEAMKNGQIVQWQDRYGEWNDVEPGTSELVMARDIGSKLRIKTDEEGNPIKQKSEPEPSMKEARDKLLELEKRRKKFAPYPELEEPIRMEQSKYLFKAGFESREDFDNFVKSEGLNDAAPRQLTGDCKIRIRK